MKNPLTPVTEEEKREILHLAKDAVRRALDALPQNEAREILSHAIEFGEAIRRAIHAFPATLKKREPELGNPDVSLEPYEFE